MPTVLRVVLGDQLDPHHSWFSRVESDVLYAFFEVHSEQTARQHVQRAALFFAAMRAFAAELREAGHVVHYQRITDADAAQDLIEAIRRVVLEFEIRRVELQPADAYAIDRAFRSLESHLGIPVSICPDEHFLATRELGTELFGDSRHWLMERFYRQMRTTHKVLLTAEGKPEGGRWNYDADNRDTAAKAPRSFPEPLNFGNDYTEVLADIHAAKLPVFGSEAVARFHPITRPQALRALEHFMVHALPHFGQTQDVMLTGQPTQHHSLLSFALNVKLLNPREVIAAAEQAYREGKAPLNAVEGFIRQILGWREYMRCVYWAKMPDYATTNFFAASRPLPAYYWTGDTSMSCVREAVTDSLEHAYAHHIQRLMVTGNFATLIGVAPAEINAWYLGIYADALEWVQLPNTHGMSQWADGGLVATKPYVSGGAYLKKMSNYCRGCHYDPEVRYGPRACPFNSLYWSFLAQHEGALARNPRMAQMYATWRKMSPEVQQALLAQAQQYLDRVDEL